MVVYCCSNTSGDHIRVVRGATESNPHGTYDHHMLVIAVIDDVTLHVIHYTGEVADAAADSAVTSFGSFGSFGGGEDVDCEGGGGTRGGSAAVKEQKVRIQVRTEKVEVLEYPEQRGLSLFPPDEAIKRARSRLGEKEYGLFKNNCECFVNWAVTGIATSNQYESGKWSALLGAAVGAVSGYWKEGFSGAAKGAVKGAQQSYQNYRENRP